MNKIPVFQTKADIRKCDQVFFLVLGKAWGRGYG